MIFVKFKWLHLRGGSLRTRDTSGLARRRNENGRLRIPKSGSFQRLVDCRICTYVESNEVDGEGGGRNGERSEVVEGGNNNNWRDCSHSPLTTHSISRVAVGLSLEHIASARQSAHCDDNREQSVRVPPCIKWARADWYYASERRKDRNWYAQNKCRWR